MKFKSLKANQSSKEITKLIQENQNNKEKTIMYKLTVCDHPMWLLEVSLQVLAISREFLLPTLKIIQSISPMANLFRNMEWTQP